MKFKHVVYENISDKFDNGKLSDKVKVTVGLVFPLPKYKLSGPITQVWYKLGS